MNTLGVPFGWKKLNMRSGKTKTLNFIISLCQKEIVSYKDMPIKHGRVEMAKEIMKIINKNEK
jgi:hypothetical protein